MKTRRSTDQALGILATGRTLQAVLVTNGPDGPEVVRRLSRQRSLGGAATTTPNHAMAEVPTESFAQDFTIQIGEASSGRELFLSSEFSGLEPVVEPGEATAPATFDLELDDLLAECRDAGYAQAELAFVLHSTDVKYIEVSVPRPAKGAAVDRAVLAEALGTLLKSPFEEERVAFLPMTTVDDASARYLAVVPKGSEPVLPTLRALREDGSPLPPIAMLDAEVPLYAGIIRAARRLREDGAEARGAAGDGAAAEEAPAPTTVLVRAGTEDTLVLFLQGDTIRHCESLRSLTAFDSPETICSRVLLQQDEHGLGDVEQILVLTEGDEARLMQTFELFFATARIESVRDYLPKRTTELLGTSTAALAAATAALRAVARDAYAEAFEEVNLLPDKELKQRRQLRLPVSWPAVVLGILVACTSVFFLATYTRAEGEIGEYHERLQKYAPETLTEDINVLQARIDSMQQLYDTYTRALQVLDTLLLGSDRWSRALETTANEAARARGLWIESMSPEGNTLLLEGNATTRDRIVAFAERTNGVIESLAFSDVREWPVFAFRIRLSVEDDIPEAAKYLREQALPDTPAAGTAGGSAPEPTR